jgi:hypothetical protein
MTDDGGVLGNLPNARPGRRSEKRPATPRAASTQSAQAPAKPRAEKRATRPPDETASRAAKEAPTRAAEEAPADRVSEVIRAATGLAGVGARVANGVAREVVRRLPRP